MYKYVVEGWEREERNGLSTVNWRLKGGEAQPDVRSLPCHRRAWQSPSPCCH